ncbi:MAG: glycosyltransferase family 2 protein [Vitreimonas sp.]
MSDQAQLDARAEGGHRAPTRAFIDQVTPLIITYNEEANIERTLSALRWAKRIVVVDSGSTDATLAILARDPRVVVHHNPFESFARQCQFGLARIETEWALSLDADYELSEALIAEIARLRPADSIAGYTARFVYRIHGRNLRGTLYPPRTVLYRRALATYRDIGHGHRVEISGAVEQLEGPIFHDDRKPLSRWFASQQRYAQREADHLLSAQRSELSWPDRLRLMMWPAPPLVLFYTLFAKGCILDGWAGWSYALQRLTAETMLALELCERRLSGRAAHVRAKRQSHG